MKTLNQVEVQIRLVKTIPEKLEPNTFYISKEFMTSSHLCLCGCGGQSVTPLSKISDTADLINPVIVVTKAVEWWSATIHNNKLSMHPSIRNSGLDCKSHYVVNKGIANILEH